LQQKLNEQLQEIEKQKSIVMEKLSKVEFAHFSNQTCCVGACSRSNNFKIQGSSDPVEIKIRISGFCFASSVTYISRLILPPRTKNVSTGCPEATDSFWN